MDDLEKTIALMGMSESVTVGQPTLGLVHAALVEVAELRARLAAQQPVIDAAEALRERWRSAAATVRDGVEDTDETVRDLIDALSGSVEAADTPPSGTSGHEADTPAQAEQHRLDVWERDDNDWTWRCTCQLHGASWPSERAAQEAADEHVAEASDTPVDPDDTIGSLTGDCCPMMRDQSTLDCEQHHDHPIDCPDVLVLHGPQGPGLPIRDGGSSWVAIRYCPWCATDLCAQEVADTPAEPDAAEVAALLRACAAGRREYAENAAPHAVETLAQEAATFDTAAALVEGNYAPLYGLLPSWRWTDAMEARVRDWRGTATTWADVATIAGAAPEREVAGTPAAEPAPEGLPQKLREMAGHLDEALAHHREYDAMDEPIIEETARRLRAEADALAGAGVADEPSQEAEQ